MYQDIIDIQYMIYIYIYIYIAFWRYSHLNSKIPITYLKSALNSKLNRSINTLKLMILSLQCPNNDFFCLCKDFLTNSHIWEQVLCATNVYEKFLIDIWMFFHVTGKRYLFDVSKKKFGDSVAHYWEMCCTKVL